MTRRGLVTAAWLAALGLGAGVVGCGNDKKAEAPAQFAPHPTGPPTGGVEAGGGKGKKDRGPADKQGDG